MLFPTPFPVTRKLWIGTWVDPAQTLAAGTGFPDTVVIAFASKFHPRNKRASGKKGFNHRGLASICAFRLLFTTIFQSKVMCDCRSPDYCLLTTESDYHQESKLPSKLLHCVPGPEFFWS